MLDKPAPAGETSQTLAKSVANGVKIMLDKPAQAGETLANTGEICCTKSVANGVK